MKVLEFAQEVYLIQILFLGLEGQHQQQGFDPNAPDPNAPMEQLSQQLQRLPQPQGPQINVIPQHHMQAPQPPQLHPGWCERNFFFWQNSLKYF